MTKLPQTDPAPANPQPPAAPELSEKARRLLSAHDRAVAAQAPDPAKAA